MTIQCQRLCTEEIIEKIPMYVGRKNRVHFGLEMGLTVSNISSIEERHRGDLFGQIKAMLGCVGQAYPHGKVPVRDVAGALCCIGEGFTDFMQLLSPDQTQTQSDWNSGF